jgi:hypothetical protein
MCRRLPYRNVSRKIANTMAPAVVLAAGFFLRPAPTIARPDYTRRTKQDCSYCHLPGGWNLNDAGHYFEKHRSLNGYQPAEPPKQSAGQKAANPENAKAK